MLSDKDSHRSAAVSPSFDKGYILHVEEDFQNMDSYNPLGSFVRLVARVRENNGRAVNNTDLLPAFDNCPFEPIDEWTDWDMDKDNNSDSGDDNDVNSY